MAPVFVLGVRKLRASTPRVDFTDDLLTGERYVRVTDGEFVVIAPASAHESPAPEEFLLRPLALDGLPEVRWSMYRGRGWLHRDALTCVIQSVDGIHWRASVPREVVYRGPSSVGARFGGQFATEYREVRAARLRQAAYFTAWETLFRWALTLSNDTTGPQGRKP